MAEDNIREATPETVSLEGQLRLLRKKTLADVRKLSDAVGNKLRIEQELNDLMHRALSEEHRDILKSKTAADSEEKGLLKTLGSLKLEKQRYLEKKRKIDAARQKQQELREKLKQLDALIKSELERR